MHNDNPWDATIPPAKGNLCSGVLFLSECSFLGAEGMIAGKLGAAPSPKRICKRIQIVSSITKAEACSVETWPMGGL